MLTRGFHCATLTYNISTITNESIIWRLAQKMLLMVSRTQHTGIDNIVSQQITHYDKQQPA